MPEKIFDSKKSNEVYNDGEDYYSSSEIVVGDECVVLDMYYKARTQNARDQAREIRAILIKQEDDFQKVVREQPDGRVIGLGTMKDGFYDRITIKEKGIYKIVVKSKHGLDIFRNFDMAIYSR